MSNESEQIHQHQQHLAENVKGLFKDEFLNTIKEFTNELDLVFEAVPKQKITELKKLIKRLKKNDDEALSLMKKTGTILSEHETSILAISDNGKKVKSADFVFLDNLSLFDDILHFELFKNENKNTKKTLVKYLKTLMTYCNFVEASDSPDMSMESLTENLNHVLKLMSEKAAKVNHSDSPKKKKRLADYKRDNVVPNMEGMMSQMGNLPMGNLLGPLLQNKEIMDMAKDLSKTIEQQNIDPMTMLSSLMSGKPNKKVNNLIQTISGKIEKKIESGELDKEQLQEQAGSIVSAVQKTDLFQQLLPKQNGM